MLDRDVRSALRKRLEAERESTDTLVRDELGLCLGQSRVDLAVINGRLVGYEIKSARDRLDRLPGQVSVYGRVLDQAVLVSARRHVDTALRMLPSWWGLWAVRESGERTLEFVELRRPKRNRGTDPLAVAQLLWRNEALALLAERGLDRGLRSATRWRLWEELVVRLDSNDLASEVRSRLRARQEWSTASPRSRDGVS